MDDSHYTQYQRYPTSQPYSAHPHQSIRPLSVAPQYRHPQWTGPPAKEPRFVAVNPWASRRRRRAADSGVAANPIPTPHGVIPDNLPGEVLSSSESWYRLVPGPGGPFVQPFPSDHANNQVDQSSSVRVPQLPTATGDNAASTITYSDSELSVMFSREEIGTSSSFDAISLSSAASLESTAPDGESGTAPHIGTPQPESASSRRPSLQLSVSSGAYSIWSELSNLQSPAQETDIHSGGPLPLPASTPAPIPAPGSSKLPHSIPGALESPGGLPLPIAFTPPRKGPDFSLALQNLTLLVYSFLLDSCTRQLYLYFLLRMPSLYFSRVARIFEDAQFSLPEIKRMALDEWNSKEIGRTPHMFLAHQDRTVLPPSLLNFRSSWEGFIDSLMREWKTLNIISVLLLSAILTMLQIEAAAHPITRTSALCSLICALMSLLYGCMYIIRFGTMRKLHKASSFATEAQKDTASIWWNVWVLLAMPATWLAWSIIMFLTCIMSFIWLSGSDRDTTSFAVSPQVALGFRIGLTVVFSLALIYFVLIVKTFHRYGDALDQEWMRTVNGWATDEATSGLLGSRGNPPQPHALGQSGANPASRWTGGPPSPGVPRKTSWRAPRMGPSPTHPRQEKSGRLTPLEPPPPPPRTAPVDSPNAYSGNAQNPSSPVVVSSDSPRSLHSAEGFHQPPAPPPRRVRVPRLLVVPQPLAAPQPLKWDNVASATLSPTIDVSSPGELGTGPDLPCASTQVGDQGSDLLKPPHTDAQRIPLHVNRLLQPPRAPSVRPFLRWNMLFSSQHSHDLTPELWWEGRRTPATFPAVTSLSIVSAGFPWVINVSAKNLSIGVTCGELVDCIYENLHQFVMEAEYEALHSTQKHLIAGAYQHNCSGASGVPGRQLQSPRHRLDWLGHSIMFGGIRENDSLVKDVRGDIQPCTLELVCITSDRAEEEIADQEGLDGLRNEIETARHSFKAPYEAEGVDFDDGKLEEIEGVGEEREGSRLEATEEGLRDDGNGEEDEEFEYILEEWECDLPTATLTTRVALTTI